MNFHQNKGDQLDARPLCIFLLAGGKKPWQLIYGILLAAAAKTEAEVQRHGQMSKSVQAVVCFLGYQRLRCHPKPVVTDSISRSPRIGADGGGGGGGE